MLYVCIIHRIVVLICVIHRSMYVSFKTFSCGMFELGSDGWVSFRCDEVSMGEWVSHMCGSGSGSGCGFAWCPYMIGLGGVNTAI